MACAATPKDCKQILKPNKINYRNYIKIETIETAHYQMTSFCKCKILRDHQKLLKAINKLSKITGSKICPKSYWSINQNQLYFLYSSKNKIKVNMIKTESQWY